MSKYLDIHRRSIENPSDFWGEAAEGIDWESRWDKVLDDTNPPFYRWFAGGEMNTCYNAVDRHVEGGRADQVAIIYDSPVTNTIQKFTYRELRDLVANFAGVLKGQGVEKGDTVIIYMPMIPQAAISMLAWFRTGRVPGRPRQTGQTWELGSPPNSARQGSKILAAADSDIPMPVSTTCNTIRGRLPESMNLVTIMRECLSLSFLWRRRKNSLF